MECEMTQDGQWRANCHLSKDGGGQHVGNPRLRGYGKSSTRLGSGTTIMPIELVFFFIHEGEEEKSGVCVRVWVRVCVDGGS